jgi:hypothetical protein
MASIHLKMGVDNAQFKTGLEQAKSKAEGFKKSVSKVMGGVLAVAGAGMAVNKVIQGIDAIRDKYDRLAKLTKQHGDINTDFFQRAAFVAEQNGTNVEAVAKSMTKLLLSTRMAAQGSKQYVDAFKDLNINIKEFQSLGQEEKFKAISDAVRDAADSTKAQEAVLITMGARATELIPMLKGGAEGFEELAESVHVLSGQGLRDIEDFNDALHSMKMELTTLAATKLPPVLNELIDQAAVFHDIFKDGFFDAFKGEVTMVDGQYHSTSPMGRRQQMLQEKREQRSNRNIMRRVREQELKNLNRSGLTGTARENALTKIREAQSVEDIIGVKELMHDEKMRQEAIQTQQEFFPKDAGKSSTLLDHILGELQKVNQSGIEIKGRGINDVQLSQEPTSNAFEN